MVQQITKLNTDSLTETLHMSSDLGFALDKSFNIINSNDYFKKSFNTDDFEITSLNQKELIEIRQTGDLLTVPDNKNNTTWKFKFFKKEEIYLAFGSKNNNNESEFWKKEYEEFLYLVSHDLNEPSRTIKSFTNFLIEDIDKEIPAKAIEDIEFIRGAAYRLENKLKGLLKLSRTIRKKPTSTKINPIVFINDLVNKLNDNRIIYENQTTQTKHISTCPNLLEQILVELINNGLKFNHSQNKQVRIIINDSDINIIDNGIGFDKSQYKNIFKPFHKLHSYEKYEGVGIGLSLIEKAINKINFKMDVFSQEGKGSSFILSWE